MHDEQNSKFKTAHQQGLGTTTCRTLGFYQKSLPNVIGYLLHSSNATNFCWINLSYLILRLMKHALFPCGVVENLIGLRRFGYFENWFCLRHFDTLRICLPKESMGTKWMKSPKSFPSDIFSCFQFLVARARRWGTVTREYGVDSWDGPNSGTERCETITNQCGHHRSLRTSWVRDALFLLGWSEVDPQCVLIFEADLRNPL